VGKINYILAGIGGYIVGLLGGIDVQLRALILIMVLDFISGFLGALVGTSTKSQSGFLSSKAAGAGIVKKIAYLICVIVAVVLEETTGLTFIREIVIISFVITETLSVLENCTRLGIKPPKIIYNVLDTMKKRTEEKDNDGTAEG
jgi:toxin secretion/phage lysis holin